MKDQQVGGSHYANKKIDPFTFAMENKWDPMLFSILKYLTRYKDKGTPLQDLQKAMHIADYRKQFPAPSPQTPKIFVEYYCHVNNIERDVVSILVYIEELNTDDTPFFRRHLHKTMDTVISLIKELHDSEAAKINLFKCWTA